MKKITLSIIMIFILISCSDTKEKKALSKSEKLQNSIDIADLELENENEKIALISIMRNIPRDSVYLILRDYYTKSELSFDLKNDHTEKFIDTISKNRKISKKKVASIIFNFKYEMRTKEEIEQEAIEDYQEFENDVQESEDQY